jgi:hypothetical protein
VSARSDLVPGLEILVKAQAEESVAPGDKVTLHCRPMDLVPVSD